MCISKILKNKLLNQKRFNYLNEISYRKPRKVKKINYYKNGRDIYVFPACPRCKISIEREFQSYCDRCGQKLDWKKFGYNKFKFKNIN